jgi:ubiquinone/menaquinone biosynthesis C-methylase UbiE
MPRRRSGRAPAPSGARWLSQVESTWNEAASGWERWEAVLLNGLRGVDPWLIRAIEPRAGQRILDFACGIGEPTLCIAPMVEPGGRVLGVDLARRMIEVARRRARAAGVRNARFLASDVARLPAREGRFHAIVSRYGIMFPENVPGLLAALRARLRPGGRLALAVWGPRLRNAYFDVIYRAILPHLASPPDPERTPHAMRFARAGRLTRLVRRAGFRDVRVRGVRSSMVFDSPEQCVQMVVEVSGSTRDALKEISPRARRRALEALRRGAARYRDGQLVRLPGFSWVVSARR